jgi:hypothetical protein
VNKPVVFIHGHVESGLKEGPTYNLNYVSDKGDVEFSTGSCCKTKEKGLKVNCLGETITFSSNIELGQDYSHWKDDSEEDNKEFF